MLRRSIENEAELRFALADPILKLILEPYGMWVGQYVVAVVIYICRLNWRRL